MEGVAAILVAAGSLDASKTQVTPGKPHSNTLRMMLGGSADPWPPPSKLWLFSTWINGPIPVPTFVRTTHINLRPELKSFSSILL